MIRLIRDKLGICQWFHYEDYRSVERAVEYLTELGIRHLRTGISWADYHRPRGRQWYEWQMRQLADFEILMSVWHTPPSIAEGSRCNGPPVRLDDYTGFIWQIHQEYGEYWQHLELWNEPNNRLKWNFIEFDPQWAKFGEMIRKAARQARLDGKTTVLGGMIPVDHHWLNLMKSYHALDDIDIVAIHAFPGMWWPNQPNWDWYSHWSGWDAKVEYIQPWCDGRPVWVTETGLATWDLEAEVPARFEMQCSNLERAAAAPAERVYWYSLIDLDPRREAIEGFHVDENEYHMGLVTFDGVRKDAFYRMKDLLAGVVPVTHRRSAAASATAN